MRIFINNEEVVCKNNIQITEKMLSTSSTILNNCYPLSWESDKDYTSRFYFPKDYSKCKIFNEIYHPEIPGITVKGTNLQINYNNEEKWLLKGLFGNSYQNGTPTPLSPVPIECVTGEQDINICGKNLFDKSTIIEGKYIDASGNFINDNNNFIGDFILIDNTKSYYISASSGQAKRIAYYDNSKSFISRQLISAVGGLLTIPNNAKYVRLSCYNVNLNSLQLEQNNQSTTYEEYFSNTYEINLGSIELNKIENYEDKIYKQNDNWYIEKNIGKVVLDGSETWNLAATYTNNTRFTGDNVALGKNTSLISDYFVEGTGGTDTTNIDTNGSSGKLMITIPNSIATTSSALTTWLTSHNTTVLYQLSTPTYTTITNESLIEELETIYYSDLYKGINNISVLSANLPTSLEILYNYYEEYTEEDVLFCGCIKNTGKISLNPREPHYCDLQVLDFKTLLSEGETLNYVINNKTITQAINQVVNSISDYGFVVGEIHILNPDDIINAYSTLNKTAYDVFQYIAEVTQSRWFTRMVDENTVAIDFYDPSLMTQGLQIESTTDFYKNYDIEDMSFNYSTKDYRNKQIMTSDKVIANITQSETIIADGYSKTFICQNKIGTITKITVNGVEKIFITKSQEQLGISGDFVYQPGDITFTSKNNIPTGYPIVITYYPIIKGREIVLDTSESSRIQSQIGRKGTISRYENRNDTNSSVELQKIGKSYIKYKGSAEITLKIITGQNLWNIGQIVHYNAPIPDLTKDYMVKSKTIDWYLNNDMTFYTYELISNYNFEDSVNYFDNQRAKNQGNIGEGETITRNIDLTNEALILFYDTEISEIQVQNPTSLDFALDGVLI